MDHILVVRSLGDAALRTDADVALAVRVDIDQEGIALCCRCRNCDREGVDDRIVGCRLVVTVGTGPDQCAVCCTPLEVSGVGCALCRSAERQVFVKLEVHFCTCGTCVILDSQVDLDLLTGLDIVAVRAAGCVSIAVRHEVVDDRIARINRAAAVTDRELQGVELERNIARLGNAALRTDTVVALPARVQTDLEGVSLGCGAGDCHCEGVDDRAVCCLLVVAVCAGPDQCVRIGAVLEAAAVGAALCGSAD